MNETYIKCCRCGAFVVVDDEDAKYIHITTAGNNLGGCWYSCCKKCTAEIENFIINKVQAESESDYDKYSDDELLRVAKKEETAMSRYCSAVKALIKRGINLI